MSRLSATTAFATRSEELGDCCQYMEEEVSRSFMAVHGRGRCNPGQDYPDHRFRDE